MRAHSWRQSWAVRGWHCVLGWPDSKQLGAGLAGQGWKAPGGRGGLALAAHSGDFLSIPELTRQPPGVPWEDSAGTSCFTPKGREPEMVSTHFGEHKQGRTRWCEHSQKQREA